MDREKQIEEMAKDLCDINCKGMKCDTCDSYGCEYRMQAEALYNAGYRKQEWISVDERLPDGYGSFLVAFKSKLHWKAEWVYCVGVAIYNVSEIPSVNGWDFEIGDGYEYIITHWMPLPTPPKEDKND
jgi:hypothetical protein